MGPLNLFVSPIGGWWLFGLLVTLFIVLLLFVPVRGVSPRWRGRTLILLRFTAIALLLGLMLRPTLVHTRTLHQPGTVVVLIDGSRSMNVADAGGGVTRWDAARAAVQSLIQPLNDLSEDVTVDLFRFSEQAEPVQITSGKPQLDAPPTGKQTALGAALDDALRREQGKRILGVVLLSDGAQRSLPPHDMPPQTPARRMAELGFPLFAVPLGQSRGAEQGRDIAIETLIVPRAVFAKNEMDITAVVRASGFVNQPVTVQLEMETSPGKLEVVASQKHEVREENQRLNIEFTYVPELPGEFKVTVRVPPQPGELVTTNNQMSSFFTVLTGGLRVLYLEGLARVEQKFIRRSLDASPDINVDYLRLDARKPETRPADMLARFEPGKYDVYFLGDLDSAALTVDELTKLAANVDRGAGLLMLGGFHSFGAGGYGNTPLKDVLPITIDRFERQDFSGRILESLHLPKDQRPRMKPTQYGAGQRFLLLADRAGNDAAWAKLPPLDGANKFSGLKQAAQVLIESERGDPLLVAGNFGGGRVLAFAGDSTWHWVMQGYESDHRRFWRQTILWLARKDISSEGDVWVELPERRFAPGSRVEVAFGANDEQGEPVLDAEFKAIARLPNNQTVPLRTRREEGRMLGVLDETLLSGDYTIEVTAVKTGQPLGESKARFFVFERDWELDNSAADRGALESMVKLTGGRTLAPEQLAELLTELQAAAEQLEAPVIEKTTLWDKWPALLLVFGVLTSEWYLRKRWGLV